MTESGFMLLKASEKSGTPLSRIWGRMEGFLYRNNKCKLCFVIFARGFVRMFFTEGKIDILAIAGFIIMTTVLENWTNIYFVCIPANGCMKGIRYFTGQSHRKNNSVASADSKHRSIALKTRSSSSKVSYQKTFLKNLVNFTEKHQRLCIFLNKCTALISEGLHHWYSPVNIYKFFGAAILLAPSLL